MIPQAAGALSDPKSFRRVFATPEETLAFAYVDVQGAEAVSAAATYLSQAQESGVRVRVIAFDPGAALKDVRTVDVLDSSIEPLLPAILKVADVVLAPSDNAQKRLSEVYDREQHAPKLLRTLADVRTYFGPKSPASPSKRRQLVLQNDWGIGDELLLSAVAREIVRENPGSEVWIRSRHGFRFPRYIQGTPPPPSARVVETIYQNATLYGPEAHSPFPGHLVQQMLDKVALDTGLSIKARDIRPELELPIVQKTTTPTVILHSQPNPRLPSKDWGVERWSALVKILNSSGVTVRQVGHKNEQVLPGVQDLRGMPVAELPAIFAESWGVVCVVGFLMHLAEATKASAVVIYGGREHPAIDGYPDQVHLSSGPLECRGRWGCHLGPDLSCPHDMQCMKGITPELVAEEILAMIGERGS